MIRFILPLAVLLFSLPSHADIYKVTNTDYLTKLRQLQAGDTLILEPGIYTRGLPVYGLNGRPSRQITITGTSDGKAEFRATNNNNIINISDSSHITIRNLYLNGMDKDVDGVHLKKRSIYAHHINIENLRIYNLARNQQAVGISTKSLAWSWVIKGNVILNTGTGIYLGDSDGSAAFIGGLIENNKIINSIGYNLQIKHQKTDIYPKLSGADISANTIIRNNSFVKTREWNSQHPRPNVLVGHQSLSGSRRDSYHIIYGNTFINNQKEALFQGEGNIALYNNLFYNQFDSGFPAIAIQPHNSIPRDIFIFQNTVVTPGQGITYRQESDAQGKFVKKIIGNAIFSNGNKGADERFNIAESVSEVENYYKINNSATKGIRYTPLLLLKNRVLEESFLTGIKFLDYEKDISGKLRKRNYYGAYE